MTASEPIAAEAFHRPLKSRLFGLGLVAAILMVATLLFGNIALVLVSPGPPGPGDPAPDFQGVTMNGAPTGLQALRGQVVLLDFFSTNCPGCVGATPKLNRLQARYARDGFTVISLAQPPDDAEVMRAFVTRRELEYPVMLDATAVADAYGIYAYPTVVLVDRQGRIHRVFRGAVSETHLAKEVEGLLARRG